MSGNEKVFEPHIEAKNSQLGSQKIKNSPKIKSKTNVRIAGIKKIKVVALYELTPKQVEPYPNPKNSLFLAPKK